MALSLFSLFVAVFCLSAIQAKPQGDLRLRKTARNIDSEAALDKLVTANEVLKTESINSENAIEKASQKLKDKGLVAEAGDITAAANAAKTVTEVLVKELNENTAVAVADAVADAVAEIISERALKTKSGEQSSRRNSNSNHNSNAVDLGYRSRRPNKKNHRHRNNLLSAADKEDILNEIDEDEDEYQTDEVEEDDDGFENDLEELDEDEDDSENYEKNPQRLAKEIPIQLLKRKLRKYRPKKNINTNSNTNINTNMNSNLFRRTLGQRQHRRQITACQIAPWQDWCL